MLVSELIARLQLLPQGEHVIVRTEGDTHIKLPFFYMEQRPQDHLPAVWIRVLTHKKPRFTARELQS